MGLRDKAKQALEEKEDTPTEPVPDPVPEEQPIVEEVEGVGEINCPACNAINSGDSSLCFSCGTREQWRRWIGDCKITGSEFLQCRSDCC